MFRDDAEFGALYFAQFASAFGFVTLLTLLPTFIDRLDPTGFEVGMFTTGLTLAQTLAVVPLALWGDRGDKRTVLIVSLVLGAVAYLGFAQVATSEAFILARGVQGVALTGIGLMALGMVGELAPPDERANRIGKANAARFAAGIGGTLSAGALAEWLGLDWVFGVLLVLVVAAAGAALLFLPPDRTAVSGIPFADLALNRRVLTVTSFRAQYAVAVTLVRTWMPIYVGVEAARGGLAYGALAVGVVLTAEKVTNMLLQPFSGRLSDGVGRTPFIALGGGAYGLIAFTIPATPVVGSALGLPSQFPVIGEVSPAFLPLLVCNALLGVADSLREPASMAFFADEGSGGDGVASSFGVRELVWRPGSVLAPLLGGYLMADVGMEWVFYVGGASALTGVAAFLGILAWDHGRNAVATW